MASSVVTATSVDVLMEPFNNLTAWTGTGGSIVTSGRTGSCLQLPGTQIYNYAIPDISESDYVTVGMAYQVASLAANRNPLMLKSDDGTINHITVRVQPDGSLQVLLGGVTGSSMGTTAVGLVVAATWVYIELQVRFHDTLGTAKLRVNGTQVLSVGPVDTRNAGTKSILDTISTIGTTGVVEKYDDLYLTTGAGAVFKGSINVTNPNWYLSPTVGTADTPDTPNQTIASDTRFTAKVQLTSATANAIIVSKWTWLEWFWGIDGSGATIQFASSLTGAGADTNVNGLPGPTLSIDVYIGIQILSSGVRSLSSTDGVTWTPGSLVACTPYPTSDSFSQPMKIGIRDGNPAWPGRIYWVKAETIDGSGNPTGTTWKFDAGEHVGTGTSFTDPRGRVWTLTSASAIVMP